LGGRKDIRPVKTEWRGAGVVICLERGADLSMAQQMPLPLTVSCFSKIQIGFTFLVPDHHPGSPGQRAVKRVCVCVCRFSNWGVVLTGNPRRLFHWRAGTTSRYQPKPVKHSPCRVDGCGGRADQRTQIRTYCHIHVVFNSLNSTENYGRRCLTPLSPHRNYILS